MFKGNSEYDTGVNTFSPEGRIYQIEYAMNACNLGSSGLGMLFKDGVVLVCEKKQTSILVERSGFEKIYTIDQHVKCMVSGLIADSQKLLESSRSEAHYHRFLYKQSINIKPLAQCVADLALNFGEGDITTKQKPIARPYGVSLLFGGIDRNGPSLYQTDPSGTLVGYLAVGIGSAKEGIQQLLDQHYQQDMSKQDALILSLSILKQVMEEKIRNDLIEVHVITKDEPYKVLNKEQLDELLKHLKELN